MNKNIDRYFKSSGSNWLKSAYQQSDSLAPFRLDFVINLIESMNSASILDIGCGDGRLLRKIRHNCKKTGIDYSNSMLSLSTIYNSEIDFHNIDLNSTKLKNELSKLGRYELLIMLGVIHYLEYPLNTLKALKSNLDSKKGYLIISFRNRLFNLNKNSKYYDSTLLSENFPDLIREFGYWCGIKLLENYESQKNCEIKKSILQQIQSRNSFEGITDHSWNPNSYEHWRQFTPLEACTLIERSGLMVVSLHPLAYDQSDKNYNLTLHGKSLALSSSFILVAKYQIE